MNLIMLIKKEQLLHRVDEAITEGYFIVFCFVAQ